MRPLAHRYTCVELMSPCSCFFSLVSLFSFICAWHHTLYLSFFFFFSSRRRHTRFDCDWSSDVCSSDLPCTRSWREPEDLGGGDRGVELDVAARPSPLVGVAAQQLTHAVRRLRREAQRSEERRVGKECRSRWSPYH